MTPAMAPAMLGSFQGRGTSQGRFRHSGELGGGCFQVGDRSDGHEGWPPASAGGTLWRRLPPGSTAASYGPLVREGSGWSCSNPSFLLSFSRP